jgi:hypothetical protein
MLAYVFLIFAVAMRFLPHPFSFTPVGAALLFFGARGPRKQWAIPVLLLAASDVLLNRSYGYAMNWTFVFTWIWYAAIVAMGFLLRRKASPVRVGGASLATAVSFFVLSNFGVWAAWNMYPHTLAGLSACYAAAVPFFRNEVVSDVLFTAVMFGIPAVVAAFQSSHAREAA